MLEFPGENSERVHFDIIAWHSLLRTVRERERLGERQTERERERAET